MVFILSLSKLNFDVNELTHDWGKWLVYPFLTFFNGKTIASNQENQQMFAVQLRVLQMNLITRD